MPGGCRWEHRANGDWHSYVDTVAYHFSETLNSYHLNGRKVTYSVQIKMNPCCKKMPSIRQNPHRLQLGNIGLEITMKNGQLAGINDI